MNIQHPARFDQFMDSIRLNLMLWRRAGRYDFNEVAEKLGTSERTARRRFKHPETMTLGELYAWCELYGKDPADVLRHIAAEAK